MIEITKMHSNDIKQTLAILASERLENWSCKDFAEEIERPDSIVLIAKISTQLIGFCVSRLIMSGSSFANSHNHSAPCLNSLSINVIQKKVNHIETECEIYNFAVKKEFQTQGVGKLLLNCLIETAEKRNVKSCWLEVRSSNRQAISFYQKNNFNKVYERKNFYSNPVENAVVMKRGLRIVVPDKINSYT